MENDIEYDDVDDTKTVEIQEIAIKRIRLPRRQSVQQKKFCLKEERNASLKKVSVILQKSETDRSCEENQILQDCSDEVEEIQERWRKRDEAKRRLEEFEDPEELLVEKCQKLAQAIAQSQHLVVYTGAGISTAAKIPDYRGPNGIWTRLREGKDIGDHDLSLAEPTYTHMALFELYRQNILKYVVSQNCDGLHLRSGLPKTALSELHGNMYVEVCKNCKPHKEYLRLFDVTENTARYSHKTYRKCYNCNGPLVDSIVHFGERGSLQWPLNWKGAIKNAKEATTIVCLGSSLKVMKKYPWLWQMDKPAKKRPNLYIINLQWTPKDDCANVKIHGKCDDVMRKIMDVLGIEVPKYSKVKDPIFMHATELNELEMHTTTQPFLKIVGGQNKTNEFNKDCNNKFDLANDRLPTRNCDNNQCLPTMKKEKQQVPRNTNFSIDSILHNHDKCNVQRPQERQPNLTSLFNPAISLFSYNFLPHPIVGAYSDFFLYPYQTSFLYPGLHSIINPVPIYEEVIPKIEVVEKIKACCVFCDTNYNSLTCLFYSKVESAFVNQKYRYSKVESRQKPNVCVCCDYDTEEEDLEYVSNANDKELSNSSDKEQIKVKMQAGWFGKGYKKCRRFKRKAVEK